MREMTPALIKSLGAIVAATRSEDGSAPVKRNPMLNTLGADGLIEFSLPDANGVIRARATPAGIELFDNAAKDSTETPSETPESENSIMSDNQATNPAETAATETATPAATAPKRPHVQVDPSTISLGSGLPPTAGRRMGQVGRKSVYPFASLAAPVRDAAGNVQSMSFFSVPATAERPNPARALNATVSGANKKAKEGPVDPATGLHPEYKVFAVEGGAQVYRVA